MKTIEQTRRELFEAWASKDHIEHDGVCYENPYIESSWHGFNAALDAVVIELPRCSVSMFANSREAMGAMAGVEMSRTAIESKNLGLKIR